MIGNNQFTAPWTSEEDNWIKKHYPTAAKIETYEALPGRTHSSIKHRASRLGVKKLPEAISKQNSAINSGRIRTPENRAKISASLTGRKQSEETNKKRRETHKRIARYGPENANWKGENITKDESRWRARQLIPSGPCELCGSQGVLVHHKDVDPFNNDLDNLIRLCRKCHGKEHVRINLERKCRKSVS